MNYIVYADVMLFWSFIINVCALLTASKILNIRIQIKRLLLWSLITGIITDIIYIIFISNMFLPLFYALIYIFMTCMYFKTSSVRELLQKNLAVISSMILIYGIMNLFRGGEFKSLSHKIISIIIGILFVYCASKLIKHNLSGKYHNLLLIFSGIKIKATGYCDTGNTLINPYTKKPVIIMDYRIMKKITNDEAYAHIHKYHETGYIDYDAFKKISGISLLPVPYSTINSVYEIMPVFLIDNLIIIDQGKNLKNVSVGLSRYKLKNDFHILLNENITT